MNFEYIDTFLGNHGLKNPEFNALIPDAGLYKSLLFQPLGDLEYGDYFVRNVDENISMRKFRSFFALAKESNADLVMAPEYSCPWRTIQEIISNDVLPQEKKLWVIGCESIKVDEFLKNVENLEKVVWIYEDGILEQVDYKFLNPICYVFKTRDSYNILKDVVVVQFKTHQMGGTDFETDRLIRGNTVYILRNDEKSIFLITLICADGLNFALEDLPFNPHIPCLILHLQLNKEPFNFKYSCYRRDYYLNNSHNKEFLCLNWARNSKMNSINFSPYGGSAFYTKSKDLNFEDKKMCINHKLGLYYSRWADVYAHIFFLNYDEFVFEFENTKVSQILDPIQNQNNTGPRMRKVYSWDDKNKWKFIENVDDGFSDLCCKLKLKNQSLITDNLTPIDKERLILLSTGEAKSHHWFKIENLESFKVYTDGKSSELNRRFTFSQDPNQKVLTEKTKTLLNFRKLCENIIVNKSNFPSSIKELVNNCDIAYNPSNFVTSSQEYEESSYHYNLYSTQGKAPACVAFLGRTDEESAEEVFDNMRSLFKYSQSGKRVVVWFEDIDEIKFYSDESIPKINDNVNISRTSIRKGGAISGH
jgi:hypothetical protein